LDFLYLLDIGGEVSPGDLQEKLSPFGTGIVERLPGASWIEDGFRISLRDGVIVSGLEPSIEVKVFLVGAILVKISLPVKNMDFQNLLDFLTRAEENVTKDGMTMSMSDFALDLAKAIRENLKPLIMNPYTTSPFSQSYRLVIATELEKDLLAKSEREIAGLMKKEKFDRLSKAEIEETLETKYSYRDNVVIVDVRGGFAVVNNLEAFPVVRALELYLLQKLELRVYDSLLDEMLAKSYDILEKAGSKAGKEIGRHINEIHLMRLELLEIVSGMKYTKESTRARIFSAICSTIGERFEIDDLVHSVTRKLDKLGEVYNMVYDSLQTTRSVRMERTMVLLEVIIVALIVLEIILFFAGKG
jgi:hypothetical protein